MWTHNKFHAVPESSASTAKGLAPKQPYVTAVEQLSRRIADVRALFDHFGHVRTLNTDGSSFLYDKPMLGTPEQQARDFLNVQEIASALGLRHFELSRPQATEIPLGFRVEFKQELSLQDVTYAVRGGYVHVFLNADGKVFQVNSTLRFGRRNVKSDSLISESEAIAAAKRKLGSETESERAEFAFSSHNGRLDPIYEVTLTTDSPRRVVQYLVKANSGEVVHQTNKLRSITHSLLRKGDFPRPGALGIKLPAFDWASQKKPAVTTPVAARAFARIPDPNKPISQQVSDFLIDTLPDPKVLKSRNVIIYQGGRRKEVRCKADGTFKFKPGDPEFACVVAYIAIDSQIEYYRTFGYKPPKPIEVFVDDPSVVDNAYFDPEAYEIHIGVGSGLSSGGLNRWVAFDMGVSWHEYVHCLITILAAGNDLPGSEGGALHESTSDVLGDLLMDWLFRLNYAAQLGYTITVADIVADKRIVGIYAAPPNGIRIQKNTKKTPRDKTGEVHDDGLISGGAQADLLVGLVQKHGIAAGLETFARLTMSALTLVPAHKVTFRDMLNAMLTSDQTLNGAANKQLITQSFSDHGIVLSGRPSGRGGSVPVIIIVQ